MPVRFVIAVLYFYLATAIFFSVTIRADNLKACYEEWPPYTSSATKTSAIGITIEALETALEPFGHTITYYAMPYARCDAEAAAGNIDIAFFLPANSINNMQQNTVNMAWWILGAFVPQDSSHKRYTGLQAFKGKTIGMVIGYEYTEEIENYTGWRKDSVSDAVVNMKKLHLHRLDLVIDDVPWALDLMAKEQLNIRLLQPVIAALPNYISFGDKLKDNIEVIDKTLSAMENDGRLDALYQKYTGKSYADFKALTRTELSN